MEGVGEGGWLCVATAEFRGCMGRWWGCFFSVGEEREWGFEGMQHQDDRLTASPCCLRVIRPTTFFCFRVGLVRSSSSSSSSNSDSKVGSFDMIQTKEKHQCTIERRLLSFWLRFFALFYHLYRDNETAAPQKRSPFKTHAPPPRGPKPNTKSLTKTTTPHSSPRPRPPKGDRSINPPRR
jgi:hypothetical protein